MELGECSTGCFKIDGPGPIGLNGFPGCNCTFPGIFFPPLRDRHMITNGHVLNCWYD